MALLTNFGAFRANMWVVNDTPVGLYPIGRNVSECIDELLDTNRRFWADIGEIDCVEIELEEDYEASMQSSISKGFIKNYK